MHTGQKPDANQAVSSDAAKATARLRAEHREETSLLQHAVDRLTALVGLPGFVAALTVAIVLWISANILAIFVGWQPVDPPPFFWLQGAVATSALYVATLILTTQRREERLSSLREELLLELVILIDQKSSKIIELLEESRRDNPTISDRVDNEANSMSTPSDHRLVVNALKEE